jgi:hypothetical protein
MVILEKLNEKSQFLQDYAGIDFFLDVVSFQAL